MSGVLGYWGFESRAQELFARCLKGTPSPRVQSFASKPSANGLGEPVVSAVGCWGNHSFLERAASGEALLASLSASGIPADVDISIEADSDSLRLWRESFGRATLYWTRLNSVIWFSSRLRVLLSILETAEVSAAGLYGYGCFSFVPAPLTPVENIFAIPAGSESVWRMSGISEPGDALFRETRRINEWREAENQIADEAEATRQLRGLLGEAIHAQLDALPHGPVGVFLSGGLDSSITAALLVRAGVPVRAYTLDFGQYGLSEIPFAEIVAKSLSIPLVKVPATPREIRRAVIRTAGALDAPFGDGVTAPLFLLGEAASHDTAVVFNGEGGDQLFGGWTNKPLIASSVYHDHHPGAGEFAREYMRTFHRLHGYEQSVYTERLQDVIALLDPFEWLAEALDESFTRSLLHRLRRANLMIKGAQNIQPRATALALTHGLMVRTPFCGRPLTQWTFRLSGELCLRGPCEKYLLKRAVEDWLPPEVVWREKRGMGAPLTAWCLGPLWRAIGEWLKPDTLEDEGRFQPDLALRTALGDLSGHVQGRRIGEILWLLLMWEAWRKTLLKEEFKPSNYNPFWLPPRWLQWRLRGRESP